MEVYNKVFRFLLQVKFAKWSLDEIRIGGECTEMICTYEQAAPNIVMIVFFL